MNIALEKGGKKVRITLKAIDQTFHLPLLQETWFFLKVKNIVLLFSFGTECIQSKKKLWILAFGSWPGNAIKARHKNEKAKGKQWFLLKRIAKPLPQTNTEDQPWKLPHHLNHTSYVKPAKFDKTVGLTAIIFSWTCSWTWDLHDGLNLK